MTNLGFNILRYLIAGEESRRGRTDHWNSVFLPGKTPFNRGALKLLKVVLTLILSICLMITLAHLSR